MFEFLFGKKDKKDKKSDNTPNQPPKQTQSQTSVPQQVTVQSKNTDKPLSKEEIKSLQDEKEELLKIQEEIVKSQPMHSLQKKLKEIGQEALTYEQQLLNHKNDQDITESVTALGNIKNKIKIAVDQKNKSYSEAVECLEKVKKIDCKLISDPKMLEENLQDSDKFIKTYNEIINRKLEPVEKAIGHTDNLIKTYSPVKTPGYSQKVNNQLKQGNVRQ